MSRKLYTVFGTLGIFVVLILIVSIMNSLREEPELQEPVAAAPAVFFTTAQTQSVTLDVNAQGEVRPLTDINLTAQVSGRVIETSPSFVNGGAFDEGDMLIKIEDTDYRAAVAAAKARVAQAEQTLRLEEAEADLARRDFEELNPNETPSQLTLRIPQLAQARANFEAARAEMEAAQINLQRTAIRAPFPGRVRERIAGVGQFVSPGAQLGRIFSTDVAEIRLALTDNDLAKLGLPLAFVETENNPGPNVALSARLAGKNHNWQGRIARTDGSIDSATRQVIAIAVVDDPYGTGADNGTPLAMGLFANGVITGKPYENAIVLPRSALYGRDKVYVISDDNTLIERTIEIVSSDRDTITLASGINSGERIVISPLRGAGEGDEVAPTDPQNTDEPSPLSASATRNVTSRE
ncbi:efflux RND transporter periplasmic adaptor subunit [Hyphococcus lacteus]|uniref:Efflux RND transporter periplasmic adaptor subunit n=1 Tax=Hyphococcus lacteus TaxID=3143536 RepID=A0ABV3ZBC7_9PROT